MSATKCDSWTNFVREIELIWHARKTTTAPTPMEIDALQGNCHKCGKYGHTAKECRSSSHEGAEKPQCAQCGKRLHGQCRTRSYTCSHKDSQKGGWKGDRKGNGKGTQRGRKFTAGKGGHQVKRKGKGKKGQRLNEITEPPQEQWTGGSWEQWSERFWNVEADTASWRDDDWYTADSNSQTFNMRLTVICDSRFWVLSNTLNLFNMTDWIFHSELSRLVWILLHVKLLFLPTTLQHVDHWSTKTPYLDVRTASQAETKCMSKEKGSCAPWMEQESQWPSRAEESTADVP